MDAAQACSAEGNMGRVSRRVETLDSASGDESLVWERWLKVKVGLFVSVR